MISNKTILTTDYESPTVDFNMVRCEAQIASSEPGVAVTTTITTVGQQREDLDFSDASKFNTEWE